MRYAKYLKNSYFNIWHTLPSRIRASLPPTTIRNRLVGLAALIAVPLFGLFSWTALDLAATRRDLVELHRLDVTNRLTSIIDRDIAGVYGVLTGLASSEDLLQSRFLEFERQARALQAHPEIIRIWVFSKTGQAVVADAAADVPPGWNEVKDELLNPVFRGERSVSGVQGEGLRNATVIVAIPVNVDNSVIYGLAAEIKIERLSLLFDDAGMEGDWAAAVVDRKGQYAARSLDAEHRIGQLARPELIEAAKASARSGTFENVTQEGVRVLNSYLRSDLTGWTSVVAVPKAQLEAPLRRALILTFVGGAGVLFATLYFSSLMAKRISYPVRQLSEFASALAAGRSFPEQKFDIVELDEVRVALDEAMGQAARLAALVASSGDAIVSVDLDGTIRTWNKGAEDLFGYTAEETIGKPKTTLVPQNRLAEYDDQRTRTLQGESIRVETVRRKRDGTLVHVSLDSAPIRRPGGQIIAFSSIIHDISERKAADEHRLLLMRELAHRAKNQLAIIQVIAGQTAADVESVAEFLTNFRQRLQGLAKSHELLTNQDWKGAPLKDLIKSQLQVFGDTSGNRFEISGPPVMLSAAAAEAIGLALHELATNAAKYGALSVPSGHVTIEWDVQPGNEKQGTKRISLRWVESNGRPIEMQPNRKGFGSKVLETMVARSVDGTAELDYRPEGLCWTLQFEVDL